MTKGSRALNLFFSKHIFLGSFNKVQSIPSINLPECCFIGRSNVGKSSIINAITKSKKLAKISKTPGRTQSVNIFEINKKLNLVDLPGYGYAKISLDLRYQLSNLIQSYLEQRNNLKKTYVLIDCKVGIKDIDIDTFDIITNTNKPFTVILTKIDKCSKSFITKQQKSISSLLRNYSKTLTTVMATSSKNIEGIIDVQKDIFSLTDLL
jgi:GTP-binding protein